MVPSPGQCFSEENSSFSLQPEVTNAEKPRGRETSSHTIVHLDGCLGASEQEDKSVFEIIISLSLSHSFT